MRANLVLKPCGPCKVVRFVAFEPDQRPSVSSRWAKEDRQFIRDARGTELGTGLALLSQTEGIVELVFEILPRASEW